MSDWKKCDFGDCKLVGFYQVSYPQFGMYRNLCEKHYKENKEFFANWEVE